MFPDSQAECKIVLLENNYIEMQLKKMNTKHYSN